jgi:hypothetical protein
LPAEYYGFGFDFLGLDYAKVRDADNLVKNEEKENEIIGSGNNNRLMVWKHNPDTGDYDIQFVSRDLGGFTEGVNAADIDGISGNEVIVGASFVSLSVFSFDPSDDTYVEQISIPFSGGFSSLETADLDEDGKAEIVVSLGQWIFDLVGTLEDGFLHQTYYGSFCSTLEIK